MSNPYRPPESALDASGPNRNIVFRFEIEGHSIVAQGEASSGWEQIYLDGKLVVSDRTFATISRHQLMIEQEPYEIVFRVKNILSNIIRCSLEKDGKPLKTYRCEVKPDGMILTTGIIISILLVFNASEIQLLMNGAEWVSVAIYLLALPLILIFAGLAAARGEKLIREE